MSEFTASTSDPSTNPIDIGVESFGRRVEFQLEKNRRKRLGLLFYIAAGFISLVVLTAIFVPWMHLQDPNNGILAGNPYLDGPSWAHWFGTDDQSRDIFSRLCWGSRVSVFVSFGSVGVGLTLGGFLGMFSAYYGGRVDRWTSSIMLIPLAYPIIVALFIILNIFKPANIGKLILVIGFFTIPLTYRLIRANTLAFASREFVTAAKALGASDFRVITREIFPNVVPAAMTLGVIGISTVVVLEGTLAFLGLSVPNPTASWGNMIQETTQFQLEYPGFKGIQIAFWPSLAIFMFVLSLIFVGDKLRTVFDVAESRL